MLKKLLSALICPIMLLPIFSTLPASAAQSTESSPIVGKWIWGSTIADLGADGAEIMMSRCFDEGITDVYLLVKGTGGKLGYLITQYKNLLTRTNRDVLQETIDAGHKRGIRIHAWICVVEDESYNNYQPTPVTDPDEAEDILRKIEKYSRQFDEALDLIPDKE